MKIRMKKNAGPKDILSKRMLDLCYSYLRLGRAVKRLEKCLESMLKTCHRSTDETRLQPTCDLSFGYLLAVKRYSSSSWPAVKSSMLACESTSDLACQHSTKRQAWDLMYDSIRILCLFPCCFHPCFLS